MALRRLPAPYPLDGVVDDVYRRPLRLALAGLEEEVLEYLQPVLRVAHLGVELNPVTAPFALLEGDDRDGGRLGCCLEALGDGEDRVAVARPGLLLVRGAGEEAVVALTTMSERPYSRIWTAPTSPPRASAMSCIP